MVITIGIPLPSGVRCGSTPRSHTLFTAQTISLRSPSRWHLRRKQPHTLLRRGVIAESESLGPASAEPPAGLDNMAPTNTEVKKANRKKWNIQKQAEMGEEKQTNAELELQIQGEIERAQEENLVQGGTISREEEGDRENRGGLNGG